MHYCFKDARSVSLYPYNRSHIFQYVKYTKWLNMGKGMAQCFMTVYMIAGGLPPEGQIKQPLLITTAHMHWDPEFSDVKLIQTMMLMSELKKVVEESHMALLPADARPNTPVDCNSIPIILCGDLNSLPESGMLALECCTFLTEICVWNYFYAPQRESI